MKTRTNAARVLLTALLAAASAAPAQETPGRPEDIRVPPLKWTLKRPPSRRLENGVTVCRVEDATATLVEATLLLRGGGAYDPAGKRGLATLGMEMLKAGGCGGMSPERFEEAVDALAGELTCEARREALEVRLRVLPEQFEEGARLLFAMVSRPRFEAKRFERRRATLAGRLRRRYESPTRLARRIAVERLHGSGGLGNPVGGLPGEVEKLSRSDLLAWHRRFFVPARARLGLVLPARRNEKGGLEPQVDASVLVDLLKGWRPAGAGDEEPGDAPPAGTATRAEKFRVYIAPRKGLEQTTMVVAWKAPIGRRRRSKPIVDVLRYILATRINLKVRNEAGLAYSAYASLIPSAETSTFLAYCRTKKESASQALSRLLAEIESVREERPTDDALRYVREYFINSFCHRFGNPYDTLIEWLYHDHYGYARDYLTKYVEAVKAIDADAFMKTAKECVPDKGFVVALVGEEAACRAAAEVIEEAKIEVIGDAR